MRVTNYNSFKELGEEVLEVEYGDSSWERIGYLWDFWQFLGAKGWIKVDYETFVENNTWKYLVSNEEMNIFVSQLKDDKSTII